MSPLEPIGRGRSGSGGSSPPSAAAAATAERGFAIITRLLATLRTGRAYRMGNQVFSKQLESFLEVLRDAANESGEVTFVLLEGDLYLNGTRLPFKSSTLRFHNEVRRELELRRIAGFRATRNVTPKEVEVFFELFLQPQTYSGQALFTECQSRGNQFMIPVVHASTYSMDEEADAETTQAEETGEAGTAAGAEEGTGWTFDRGGGSRRALNLALQGMQTLLHAPTEGVHMRHAKRVVQPLVDGAFASDPVVVGLTGLSHHDDYTYAHAVNVCLVAVNIGQVLGLDRRQLADLGVAVLLHDVGKEAVADLIKHPLEEFTTEERWAAERHPVEGAKLIARRTVLNQTTLRSIRVALEHHMGPAGTGYPRTRSPWGPSLLSRVTAVADCYVNLLTHRSERGPSITPHEAISIMFGPLLHRFDIAVLWGLVQVVGFYPPGQMVRLDDDSVAVVLSNHREDPARPHVKVVQDPDGRELGPDEVVEFHPLPPERSILRALSAEEYARDLGAAPGAAKRAA